MNINYDEYIGFETVLPNEVVNFLNQQNFNDQYLTDDFNDLSLDEYELAMSS